MRRGVGCPLRGDACGGGVCAHDEAEDGGGCSDGEDVGKEDHRDHRAEEPRQDVERPNLCAARCGGAGAAGVMAAVEGTPKEHTRRAAVAPHAGCWRRGVW